MALCESCGLLFKTLKTAYYPYHKTLITIKRRDKSPIIQKARLISIKFPYTAIHTGLRRRYISGQIVHANEPALINLLCPFVQRKLLNTSKNVFGCILFN